MQIDNQTKNHQAIQKNAERYAVETLTPSIYEALGLTNSESCNVKDAEEPDFIFGYRDKSIGVEVIECHPSTSKKKKNIIVRSIGCVYIYLVKNIDVLIILITMSQEIDYISS